MIHGCVSLFTTSILELVAYILYSDLQVKFVMEMLFSGCDNEEFLGKNARRMMMHLSIPIDEDLQQTLSFFEKVFTRFFFFLTPVVFMSSDLYGMASRIGGDTQYPFNIFYIYLALPVYRYLSFVYQL